MHHDGAGYTIVVHDNLSVIDLRRVCSCLQQVVLDRLY